MVEFGTSSAFRGWVRVRVLGYGFGVRGRKVKSRDCALASDLVRAQKTTILASLAPYHHAVYHLQASDTDLRHEHQLIFHIFMVFLCICISVLIILGFQINDTEVLIMYLDFQTKPRPYTQ